MKRYFLSEAAIKDPTQALRNRGPEPSSEIDCSWEPGLHPGGDATGQTDRPLVRALPCHFVIVTLAHGLRA
jgi:hypothetical protein